MAVSSETPLLIGVDGGATEVKAHAIVVVEDGLVTGRERAMFRYVKLAGFAPAPVAEQLAARDVAGSRASDVEREQGERWTEACADAIASVAAAARRTRLLVGICMPGLKTRDGRGIDVMRNGPRMPDFLDRLESRIVRNGFVLDAPIARLANDGDACGHGEQVSPDGGFRDVDDAYFLGGGTGLAECFKFGGRVTGLDELVGRIEKGWAMKSSLGSSFEEHLSMRGINARYAALGGDERVRPEEAWLRREPAAVQALTECVVMTAELLERRLEVTASTGLTAPARLVIGQRLGHVLADPRLQALRTFAEESCRVPLRISTLRAAPAIGAAHLALESRRAAAKTDGAAHAL